MQLSGESGYANGCCVNCLQGRLLVGVGSALRLYEMGKRKLLRKCENRNIPNLVVTISTMGDRIYVGDVAESISFLKYNRILNELVIFADDTHPRWMTAACPVDYDTVAGADKFGNIFLTRLPDNVSDEISEEPGAVGMFEGNDLQGAHYKAEEIVQYHVGETVCSLQKATLSPGGSDAIIYGTMFGGIGALQPFVSREDVDFFLHLEMHLRGAAGAREHKPAGEG